MKALLGTLLSFLILLLPACSPLTPSPTSDPVFASLSIHSVAVGPVSYATYQPNSQCSSFIDDDLRSALVRKLRLQGYDAFTVGNSVPRSFSVGSPLPSPGDPPPAEQMQSTGAESLLMLWIDEYWEHNPCGLMEAGKPSITMGAVAVLYAGSPLVEVWRSRAQIEQSGSADRDLIWLTTARLTDQLLGSSAAGPR